MTATLVSTLFLSLDGVAEIDPEWHFPYFDDNMAAAVDEDYQDVDALLLGRVTYDSFAGAWPDRELAGEDDAEMARRLGDMRKIVASRQPLEFEWRNSEQLHGDLVEAVKELKQHPGHIALSGSVSVVRQLLAARLVDELQLFVHPIAVGSGMRLFDESLALLPLKLLSSQAFATGMLNLVYGPDDAEHSGSYEEAKQHLPQHD